MRLYQGILNFTKTWQKKENCQKMLPKLMQTLMIRIEHLII